MNEFPPFSNGGSHTWKIKSNTSVKIATTVQESFIWQGYPGCENDGLGACETNPITTYKGYEIWEFDAYRSTVNTLQGPDVHTATNTYNIPEKSWMFRDNSTGFRESKLQWECCATTFLSATKTNSNQSCQ